MKTKAELEKNNVWYRRFLNDNKDNKEDVFFNKCLKKVVKRNERRIREMEKK